MTGKASSVIMITDAPTMPVVAARIVPSRVTEMARPPGRRRSRTCRQNSKSVAMPLRSSIVPMKMNIGRVSSGYHFISFIAAENGMKVTLLGPGGIGKTRLAQVASEEVRLRDERVVVFITGEGLKTLDAGGITVVVARSGEVETPAPRTIRLELIGNDHPGIVRDISRANSRRRHSSRTYGPSGGMPIVWGS